MRLTLFLKTRKTDRTREHAVLIMDYLESIRTEQNQGWVRAKEMTDALVKTGEISHVSNFFRLIEDMIEFKLIERKEMEDAPPMRGGPPVLYRANRVYTGKPSPDHLLEKIQVIIDSKQGSSKKISLITDCIDQWEISALIYEEALLARQEDVSAYRKNETRAFLG